MHSVQLFFVKFSIIAASVLFLITFATAAVWTGWILFQAVVKRRVTVVSERRMCRLISGFLSAFLFVSVGWVFIILLRSTAMGITLGGMAAFYLGLIIHLFRQDKHLVSFHADASLLEDAIPKALQTMGCDFRQEGTVCVVQSPSVRLQIKASKWMSPRISILEGTSNHDWMERFCRALQAACAPVQHYVWVEIVMNVFVMACASYLIIQSFR